LSQSRPAVANDDPSRDWRRPLPPLVPSRVKSSDRARVRSAQSVQVVKCHFVLHFWPNFNLENKLRISCHPVRAGFVRPFFPLPPTPRPGARRGASPGGSWNPRIAEAGLFSMEKSLRDRKCRRLMFEDGAAVLQHPHTLLLTKRSAQPAKKLPESHPISSFFSRFLARAPLAAAQAIDRREFRPPPPA
jgi:hypothetical protein